MTSLTRIPDSFWRSIGMHLVGVNDRGQLFPNIWVFHSTNISSPTMISSSSQHRFVQFFVGGIAHGLVFVYAATTSVAHRPLWSEIEQINTSFSGPLLLVGDFNAILGAHEKTGGRMPTRVSCDDFQHMVDVCHLTQIDLKGSLFTWTNGRGVGSHIEMLLDRKLKLLKPILKEWNVNVFGNVHTAVDSARAAFQKIQLAISLDLFTKVRHVEELLAQDALSNALLVQEKFWAEKARVRWVREGDRNTSYFHTLAKIRRARSSVTSLRIGNDLVDDVNILRDHVVQHFTSAFSDDENIDDTGLVENIIPSMVSDSENGSLLAIPSTEDVKGVVFSMNADSALGSDGYTGHFFQACWDVVGLDVVRAVRSFFQSGYILPNLNSSFVALIPNVQEANVITQFWPIAMANFSFKIITRILADRLAPIASRIILPNQFAFLKGRQISDCIFLISECVNLLDNKCRGGNVAIKFDVAKAFDTLNWDFLRRVLISFGFHATFVDWISSILASARRSILFNGSPVGCFGCSRGVRQGDPLSPLLFCLTEEVLSRGILRLVDMGHVQAISSPSAVKVPSHVLYADDIMVFFVDRLGIEHQLSKLLCANVSDFIKDGSWYRSSNLIADLDALWSEISAIRLPYSDMEDKLVWLDSSDGSLSLSIAYELKRSKQLKVNTDGAARGTLGLAGFGGIFRDHLGNCMGCFAGSMGIATALEAELQAIIHAVLIASGKGWTSLWIECDSAF
ncbi:uncharacterized protein LOC133728442 [Rosa rugosa]|uniref:uncharacterized protein LOC133728442 n=1 Tax=Rosa rugosa TaxID=74645 RepID=UPI002B4069B4|nr:uncharacterized protein LOC133728442 [Rosa rugosa]